MHPNDWKESAAVGRDFLNAMGVEDSTDLEGALVDLFIGAHAMMGEEVGSYEDWEIHLALRDTILSALDHYFRAADERSKS